MAKDDYYVIVYKILALLYIKLKLGEEVGIGDIAHDSLYLDINESYWAYIMEQLTKEQFIDGVSVKRAC